MMAKALPLLGRRGNQRIARNQRFRRQLRYPASLLFDTQPLRITEPLPGYQAYHAEATAV